MSRTNTTKSAPKKSARWSAAALLKTGTDATDRAFFDALGASEAEAVFRAQGFTIPE